MSEQDLRDCMKQAVWDEPPMDFDPDTFMARAEQLTKRRRALMSVGVATALIIATVATVPAIWLASQNRGVDPAQSLTATTPAPTSSTFVWPPNDTPRRSHTYEEDQPYLENMWVNHLSPALQRQGAQPDAIGVWAPTYQPMPSKRSGTVRDVLTGTVSYTGPDGPAQLSTTIAGIGAWEEAPDKMCENYKASDQTCTATKRPDGSMVVSVETGRPKNSDSYFSGTRSVYHYRTDGSVVGMASMSEFVNGATYGTGRIPLSFDQLVDLATIEAIQLPH